MIPEMEMKVSLSSEQLKFCKIAPLW